ncbi:Fe2+-dependent dioxygenase [Sphingomonas sp. LB-2]|uniref:Fe2+-dependent dioxygenase n=1 Tax=Sphingomonas caeni TaxID=2984949 RepID=UPI002231510B|nr:Fe2+-dependent dioxygenase [Sphingomonas caeni]MCW3848671.1 Fe2+-dependent dioxygenase [Sphingomonas caeni]
MFRSIPDVLTPTELAQLRAIAARASFVDGKLTAAGSPHKNNLQVGDRAIHGQVSQFIADALFRSDAFRTFAFPKTMMPPLLTRYDAGMAYGVHVDSAYMPVGDRMLRSDVSCTVFISDASDYEGGELRIRLGTSDVAIKGKAGSAILYPSSTLHQVDPVISGSRLIALTFIESRIANAEHREWLSELKQVGAIMAEKMDVETYTRLQRVEENLLRYWGDAD